jgi:hypothetical protein
MAMCLHVHGYNGEVMYQNAVDHGSVPDPGVIYYKVRLSLSLILSIHGFPMLIISCVCIPLTRVLLNKMVCRDYITLRAQPIMSPMHSLFVHHLYVYEVIRDSKMALFMFVP